MCWTCKSSVSPAAPSPCVPAAEVQSPPSVSSLQNKGQKRDRRNAPQRYSLVKVYFKFFSTLYCHQTAVSFGTTPDSCVGIQTLYD